MTDKPDIEALIFQCSQCGKREAVKYRQRTHYSDEESNWVILCPRCRKENDAYWNERWREYYADCM